MRHTVSTSAAWALCALVVVMWFVTDPFSVFAPAAPGDLDLAGALSVCRDLAAVSIAALVGGARPFVRVHEDVWVVGNSWSTTWGPVARIAGVQSDRQFPRLRTTDGRGVTLRALEQSLGYRLTHDRSDDELLRELAARAAGPAPAEDAVGEVTRRPRLRPARGEVAVAGVWAVLVVVGVLVGEPVP